MKERARSYIDSRVLPGFLAGTRLARPGDFAERETALVALHGYVGARAFERQWVHTHAGIALAGTRERLRGLGSYLFALSQLGTREQATAHRGLQDGFVTLGFDEGVAWGRAHDVIEELRTYYERHPTLTPLDPFYTAGTANAVMANKWMLAEASAIGEVVPPRQHGWLARLFG